jgi:hypothetical protein
MTYAVDLHYPDIRIRHRDMETATQSVLTKEPIEITRHNAASCEPRPVFASCWEVARDLVRKEIARDSATNGQGGNETYAAYLIRNRHTGERQIVGDERYWPKAEAWADVLDANDNVIRCVGAFPGSYREYRVALYEAKNRWASCGLTH